MILSSPPLPQMDQPNPTTTDMKSGDSNLTAAQIKRRLSNRKAAQAARARKKEQMLALEAKVEELEGKLAENAATALLLPPAPAAAAASAGGIPPLPQPRPPPTLIVTDTELIAILNDHITSLKSCVKSLEAERSVVSNKAMQVERMADLNSWYESVHLEWTKIIMAVDQLQRRLEEEMAKYKQKQKELTEKIMRMTMDLRDS